MRLLTSPFLVVRLCSVSLVVRFLASLTGVGGLAVPVSRFVFVFNASSVVKVL